MPQTKTKTPSFCAPLQNGSSLSASCWGWSLAWLSASTSCPMKGLQKHRAALVVLHALSDFRHLASSRGARLAFSLTWQLSAVTLSKRSSKMTSGRVSLAQSTWNHHLLPTLYPSSSPPSLVSLLMALLMKCKVKCFAKNSSHLISTYS